MFGELIPSSKAGDYARGATQSKALAKSKPAIAIINADNYQFFAETIVP
jgi:Lysine-specific metallo-endopeptidase